MKIVCGACGAKYSIADEKVQGKVFKIRCKKCSNVIVVKGNDDGGGDETVSESVGAAEWYVVVDGDQVGPISKVEIDSYYMSGRVNAESFAWKDGLPDWVPLSALDDFQNLTHGDAAGPEETTQISDNFSHYQSQVNSEEADSTGIMPTASSSFGEEAGGYGYDAGFSAFGGDSEASSGYEASPSFDSASSFTGFDSSSSSGGGSGGGMFASFDSPASSSSAKDNDDFLGFTSPDPVPVLGSSLSSGASTNGSSAMVNDDMVGKRNENSVLFSLSSLDQVQAVSGKSSDAAADVPVTDGSGLIDIRALASAHKSMKSGGDDHGPSVDPFTTGTMAMPALMPMGSHRSNKPMIIGGVIGALVLFSFLGIVIYLLARDNTPQTQVITEQVIVREVIKEPADDARAAADAKAAEDAAKAAMEEPSSEGTDEKATASSKTATKKTAPTSTTKTATKSEPAEERTVAAAAPAKKKGDNIDNLLAQLDSSEEPATKTKTTKSTKTATPSSSGGKSELSRDDVQNVIRANSGRINTCYRSQNSGNLTGTMRVKFMIKPNGSVGNTEILTGSFAGTDVGSCVQKAVGGMRFPATTASADVPITYPFKLE